MFRRILALSIALAGFSLPQAPASAEATCVPTKATMPAPKAKESVTAYAKRVFRASGGSSSSNLPLKLIVDPTVDAQTVALITSGVQAASKYWSKFQTIDHTLNILIAQDPAFARAQLPSRIQTQWDRITNNGTIEVNTSDRDFDGLILFNPRGFDQKDVVRQLVAPHELFHLFQSYASDGRSQEVSQVPTWLVEGTAAYFAFGIYDVTSGKSARPEYIRRLKTFARDTGNKPLSISYFKEGVRLDFSTDAASRRSQQVYSSGTLASELLYSKIGAQGYYSLFSCLRDGKAWDANFKAITGMTSAQFYKLADQYVAQVFTGKEPLMKK